MKKRMKRMISAVLAAVLLICCAPAAVAEDMQQVNILLIVGDGTGDTFYPTAVFIVVLDPDTCKIRVVNFDMAAQIYAKPRQAEESWMPMKFLYCCDTDAIVYAFESTFGITIDRYLFVAYEYGSFAPLLPMLDELISRNPVEVDIPDALMGDEPYTTVNGNMPWIAEAAGRDYTPVTGTQAQALDAVGLVSYFAAYPAVDFETVDWEQYTLDSYALWDEKCAAVFEAIRPAIRKSTPDSSNAFWMMLLDGQQTNITQEDVDDWIWQPFTIGDNAYFSVPGEHAVPEEFDASALTGANAFPYMMLTGNPQETAAGMQTFMNGE